MNAFSAFFFIVSYLIVLLKSHSHIVCSIYVNQFYSNTGDLLSKFQVILKSHHPKKRLELVLSKSRQHIFTGFLGKGASDSLFEQTQISFTQGLFSRNLPSGIKMWKVYRQMDGHLTENKRSENLTWKKPQTIAHLRDSVSSSCIYIPFPTLFT